MTQVAELWTAILDVGSSNPAEIFGFVFVADAQTIGLTIMHNSVIVNDNQKDFDSQKF